MARVLGVVVCLFLLVGLAAGEDGPPEPLTPGQAADQVLAAVQAGDEAALEAMAARDDPDPWLVADELCHRGEHDAGAEFALAAPRVDVEGLPAYVASCRGKTDDGATRKLHAAVEAARVLNGPAAALEAAGSPPPEPIQTVPGILLAYVRGDLLAALGRWGEATAAFTATAQSAGAIGWLALARLAHDAAAATAERAGDLPLAQQEAERALALYERAADLRRTAYARVRVALLGERLGNHASALAGYLKARDALDTAGFRREVCDLDMRIGACHLELGNLAEALGAYERVRAAQLEEGDVREAAHTLGRVAVLYQQIGDTARSLELQTEALRALEALGDEAGVARSLYNLGLATREVGDLAGALSYLERALAGREALGDERGAAMARNGLGVVHMALGNYTKALSIYEQSLAASEALGDVKQAAMTLHNMGSVYEALGDYAKALTTLERAHETHVASGNAVDAAGTLGTIGMVHHALGDSAQARAHLQRALEVMDRLGAQDSAAGVLFNMGIVHEALGEYDESLSVNERVLAFFEARGQKRAAARALGSIGYILQQLGNPTEALPKIQSALQTMEALGDKQGVAWLLGLAGVTHEALGNHEAAQTFLKESRDVAESTRATPILVAALTVLARIDLEAGQPARALSAASQALTATETLFGGLGEVQQATARQRHAELFAIGTLAAIRDDDTPQALRFLESGRAGALLDALGKREALRWKAESLAPELRALDLEAQAAQNAARLAYDRAVQGGDRKEVRAAGEALDEASDAVRAVAERIQRELKQKASLFYPRASTLREIRRALRGDQALVLYGLCLNEALALVLRADGQRVVALGDVAAVGEACEALHAEDTDSDPTEALARLRELLVEPLRLGGDVTQVLVSPEGPLCYLPFGALFEQPVAVTPSGTTHLLLQSEATAKGEGVLALGDPDYAGVSRGAQSIYYRGRALASLPATRREVTSIGTTTLLGAEASEAGFSKALRLSKRWRSVHFACHGLINVEKPMLSLLALSREGEDDGFLTALDVIWTEIPTDLAVLSACETGTGKVVWGEGIVGLTRAFMFAGASRVLCSLWKVDDEATQALMVKFYELWNPRHEPGTLSERSEPKGLPAAEALREAQDFVRGHDKWKHPYYWAAWVLWGLP